MEYFVVVEFRHNAIRAWVRYPNMPPSSWRCRPVAVTPTVWISWKRNCSPKDCSSRRVRHSMTCQKTNRPPPRPSTATVNRSCYSISPERSITTSKQPWSWHVYFHQYFIVVELNWFVWRWKICSCQGRLRRKAGNRSWLGRYFKRNMSLDERPKLQRKREISHNQRRLQQSRSTSTG